MLAARLGKDARIPSLLAKGADVNARDNTGSTALMIAAAVQWEAQSFKMMKALRSKGADLNAKDNQGHTAADQAAPTSRVPSIGQYYCSKGEQRFRIARHL